MAADTDSLFFRKGRGPFLDFPFTAQQVLRLLADAAARHAAAGVHHITRQRYQPEGMVACAHDAYAAVQIAGDHGAPEQVFHHRAVFFGEAAQLAGDAHAAIHGEHAALRGGKSAPLHGGDGQERGAAQPVFPQVFDQGFRILLGIRNDILHRAAQRHIQGGFVCLRHIQQQRDSVVHAGQPFLAGICDGLFYGVLIPLVTFLQFLQGFQASLVGARALGESLRFLSLAFQSFGQFPGVGFQRIRLAAALREQIHLGGQVFDGSLQCGLQGGFLFRAAFQRGFQFFAARGHLLQHGGLARLGGARVLHAGHVFDNRGFMGGKLLLPFLRGVGCERKSLPTFRQGGFRLCAKALRFVQPAIRLAHGGVNQPHPRLYGIRFALQPREGFRAGLQAVFYVLGLLLRTVMRVGLRQQRVVGGGQGQMQGFQSLFPLFPVGVQLVYVVGQLRQLQGCGGQRVTHGGKAFAQPVVTH